jgi:hypothetical protein
VCGTDPKSLMLNDARLANQRENSKIMQLHRGARDRIYHLSLLRGVHVFACNLKFALVYTSYLLVQATGLVQVEGG